MGELAKLRLELFWAAERVCRLKDEGKQGTAEYEQAKAARDEARERLRAALERSTEGGDK